MKRVIIWPDIYKEQGHWLPCVTLAKSLIDKKYNGNGYYKVEFMGIPDCESILAPYVSEAQMPNYYHSILKEIYPLGYSLENKLEPRDQRWKPHHLLPICRGALDSVFGDKNNKVDLLISGYFTGLETLMIHHKYGVPFVTITTYLRHPVDTPAMHAKSKLIYMAPAMAKKLVESVMPSGAAKTIDDFIAPMRNGKEIIPCPKAFDLNDEDWIHPKEGTNVFYVEPMVTRVPLDGVGRDMPNPIVIPPNTPFIYGCSGSQVQDYEAKAYTLFKNLILMMQAEEMSKYYLVLAVGPKLLAKLNVEFGVDIGKSTLPSNVTLRDWVSQPDIMKKGPEIVFVHGGLATIKEAIFHEVPTVIIPLGKDQMDNALRLSSKGLGMMAQMGETGPLDLRTLVTAAKANTRMKKNLTAMQKIFEAAEDEEKSLEVIEKVVPVSP